MKIQKYKTRIYQSVLEQLHGSEGQLITEYFIPEYNLCFNTDTGKLNVFYSDFGRGDGEEVEISKRKAKLVNDYYELNQEIYDMLRMYQNDSSNTTIKDYVKEKGLFISDSEENYGDNKSKWKESKE